MPEWLSRDPKMSEDQNKVDRLLVGKALEEGRWCGVWQRQPGLPSLASPPARDNGPVLCSCKMQLPQETGGSQTLAEVVIMAFTFAKLCSFWHTEGPGEKLAWFGSTADMTSMPVVISPEPSSFLSPSISSSCLPSVIV